MIRENHSWAAPCIPHTGDEARNMDMCPDQESNLELLVHRLMRHFWALPPFKSNYYYNTILVSSYVSTILIFMS